MLVALAVVCTAIGYSIWFIVIHECPINVAALTIFTQPAFGVALAGFWLGGSSIGNNSPVASPLPPASSSACHARLSGQHRWRVVSSMRFFREFSVFRGSISRSVFSLRSSRLCVK